MGQPHAGTDGHHGRGHGGDRCDDDIDDLAAYVDRQKLRAVLDGDADDLTFGIEGHDVTVTVDGDIGVA